MVELFPEARKYHLGVILAHQYLEQLDEALRAGILGNMGTLLVFRPGAPDAEALADEFRSEVSPSDLVNLPAYHACTRLLVNGTTARPFTFRTLPAPTLTNSLREKIIETSRQRYARPVAEVEWEIIGNWRAEPASYQGRLGT